jgi:hypothetical protein
MKPKPKLSEATYTVCAGPDPTSDSRLFRVSSWDGCKFPVNIYHVVLEANGKFKCNCPAFCLHGLDQSDKHIRIVKRFIKEKEYIGMEFRVSDKRVFWINKEFVELIQRNMKTDYKEGTIFI